MYRAVMLFIASAAITVIAWGLEWQRTYVVGCGVSLLLFFGMLYAFATAFRDRGEAERRREADAYDASADPFEPDGPS